jgi:hypothetical protein
MKLRGTAADAEVMSLPEDMKSQSRAPLIIAMVSLLLTVLYVVSYLALVEQASYVEQTFYDGEVHGKTERSREANYRIDGSSVRRFYWLAEKVDRMARPWNWSFDD